ncbi:MAG: FHA domain-containing protein [Bradymonadaceae bacterium]
MSEDFSQDKNRKTLRSFYCRDYLWELFEQMTRELGCSMDYLVNEAMREYARSRDFTPSGMQGGVDPSGDYSDEHPAGPPRGGGEPAQQQGGGRDPSALEHKTFKQGVPNVGNDGGQGGQGGQRNRQQSGSRRRPSDNSGGPPPPPSPGEKSADQSWQRQNQPPTKNQGGGAVPQQNFQQQASSGRPTVYLLFNNNRYPIEKDEFVIGRGSQNTDLTIRDGNISRQHCAIVYRNNNWYLKDLDSTNGVEYRGSRIESKRIEEGDVFYLCDYPLQFTYRG